MVDLSEVNQSHYIEGEMKELRVMKENPVGFLIPISTVINIISDVMPAILKGKWIFKWQDMGLGEPDFRIRGNKISEDSIEFDGDSEFDILLKGEIIVEHAEFKKLDESLKIGVFDSSFIYIKGEQNLLDKIAQKFDQKDISWSD